MSASPETDLRLRRVTGHLSTKLSRNIAALKRLTLIAALPILFGASFIGLRWYERAITFRPERSVFGQVLTPPSAAREISFLNRDQLRLYGWLFRSQRLPAQATVVFFHGQGGNIANVGWIGEELSMQGFDVLLFDYRGYGKSEGEISNEQDMYSDADAAYDYVVKEIGTSTDRLVLYGHSLGTAAAVDLASRRSCAALILESGLSSAREMAAIRLPWLPSWLQSFARNRFESAHKLSGIYSPVLVAHGDPDNVVPVEQGRELYEAAPGPKRLMIYSGAGHVVSSYAGEQYFAAIADFVRQSISHHGV